MASKTFPMVSVAVAVRRQNVLPLNMSLTSSTMAGWARFLRFEIILESDHFSSPVRCLFFAVVRDVVGMARGAVVFLVGRSVELDSIARKEVSIKSELLRRSGRFLSLGFCLFEQAVDPFRISTPDIDEFIDHVSLGHPVDVCVPFTADHRSV